MHTPQDIDDAREYNTRIQRNRNPIASEPTKRVSTKDEYIGNPPTNRFIVEVWFKACTEEKVGQIWRRLIHIYF